MALVTSCIAWRRVCVGLVLPWLGAVAAAQSRLDIDVKARMTIGLVRFVQWSDAIAPSPVLRLCVWQRAPGVVDAFRTHEVRPLIGHRLAIDERAPGAFDGCRVLYVHASVTAPAGALAEAARAGVLTVGDPDGFAMNGGMVELVAVNDGIRFDVNLGTLRSAGLGLSSQALRLARRVTE